MFHSKINKKRQAQMISLMQNLKDCPQEEKAEITHSIKMLMSLELFHTKNYVQAMRIFTQLNTQSAEVIKLIPELDNKPGKLGKMKDDLKNALKALVEYLILRKSIVSKSSGQDVSDELMLIDTTLMKCYLQLNDRDSLTKLLRRNSCKLDDAVRLLTLHEKHAELVMLYQTRGQHRKALQLLKEHFSDYSPYLTVDYLQKLGTEYLNLIFEFANSILQDHPKEALRIFTAEMLEVESLPRQNILEFLSQNHKSLVVPYLEHIIYTWKDKNCLFHNELIDLYREVIMDGKAYSEEELKYTRSKLLLFLETSSHYTPESVIRSFPTDSLFQERALILERLGRHEQALNIYIHVLGDVNKAVQYCEKTYDSTDEDCCNLYIWLLKFLLNPQPASVGTLAKLPRHPKTREPDLKTALSVLEKHVDKIPLVKALYVLPDSVPLSRLNYFLQNAIHNQVVVKRKTQVMKGLLYAENLQMEQLKGYYESTSFVVDEYNVCRLCKKRFRNQNALMRCPNGSVVHYSCGLK